MEGLVSHAEVVSLPGFQRIMMDVGVNVLDHFFKYVMNSVAARKASILPYAQLVWSGSGNTPSRCSLCHIPQFEPRLSPLMSHKCVFQRCSQFNLCLRLTDKCKDHKAEIDREKQR